MSKRSNKIQMLKVAPYIFTAPFVIYFLIFFIYPITETFWTSLCQQVGFAPPTFAGLANYKLLFDDYFIMAVQNSAIYTFFTCLILVPLPLFLAVLLDSGYVFKAEVIKSALFIPALTSVVMAGLFFKYAFSSNESAIMNAFIGFFGIEPQGFNRNNFGIASAAGISLLFGVLVINIIQLSITDPVGKSDD